MTASTQNGAIETPVQKNSQLWRSFITPSNSLEFNQAWLMLLCEQLAGIKSAILLLPSENTETFLPAAIWPSVARDLSMFSDIAKQAMAEGKGIVKNANANSGSDIHIAYPIELSHRIIGAIVLEATSRPENEVQQLLQKLHWGSSWIYRDTQQQEITSQNSRLEKLGSVMEIITVALNNNKLQESLFNVSNQIARYMKCSRVSIGLVKSKTIQVIALSNSAWFDKNTLEIKLTTAAMNECYDNISPVHYSSHAKSNEKLSAIAHESLANETKSKSIYSQPLIFGTDCLGVITLERNEDDNFTDYDCDWLLALASLLSGTIQQKKIAERNIFFHAIDSIKILSSRLFGPRHLIWKFVASILLIFFACMTLVEMEYRVSSHAVIEGEIQRIMTAPFDGFIADTHARAGDTVSKGQVLCTLDDQDLKLEKNKWSSQLDQHRKELLEAMAKHEMSDIQVISAQIAQAEAQLSLTNEKISRARIVAPFDGVVISGDLSQLVGSPIELGKELFKVAPLESYRVILEVDEREVRHIQLAQKGKILVSGISGEPIPFTVSKITPVASAENGANFFRIEAQLNDVSQPIRPGMEGVGKVNVGEHRMWWILLHSFIDWFRLQLWNWVP